MNLSGEDIIWMERDVQYRFVNFLLPLGGLIMMRLCPKYHTHHRRGSKGYYVTKILLTYKEKLYINMNQSFDSMKYYKLWLQTPPLKGDVNVNYSN